MNNKWISEASLNMVEADRSLWRIKNLLDEGYTYREICQTLNDDGILTIKGKAWSPQNLKILIFRLRHKASSYYARSQKKAGLVILPLTTGETA